MDKTDQDCEAISYEDLVRDPQLVERLRRRALRMRAIEGGNALGTAVRNLFKGGASVSRAPVAALSGVTRGATACG